MSVIDIVKDKDAKKLKEKLEKGIKPLTNDEKSYFKKIKRAIKKKK